MTNRPTNDLDAPHALRSLVGLLGAAVLSVGMLGLAVSMALPSADSPRVVTLPRVEIVVDRQAELARQRADANDDRLLASTQP